MGTRFELVLDDPRDPRDPRDPAALRAVGEAALEEITLAHDRLTRFSPSGLPARVAAASDTPIPLDPDTAALFRDALAVWHASNGAFDPTLGRGLAALGFDEATRTLTPRESGIPLDLGGIAKGHALDLAAAVLRAHGVRAAFLHGGTSSAIGIGAPAGAPGWRVALEGHPEEAAVTLRDEALSVSAAWDGNPHPTVDPRSGLPVPAPRRVAVVGPSARLTDAWATALLVLGDTPPGFPAGLRVYRA